MQSGVSLYLAIIIMSVLLAIVLGLTAILIGQMQMVREIGYSVIALSAADAGIEEVLVDRTTTSDIADVLPNGATYQVLVTPEDGGVTCAALNFCIKSIGTYEGVRRAIEITY